MVDFAMEKLEWMLMMKESHYQILEVTSLLFSFLVEVIWLVRYQTFHSAIWLKDEKDCIVKSYYLEIF